ncbi:DUF6291 domain-containing protein [uncultured Oscillibacter sp.]|uniref:DUF6291 domain-containing protein n=1 Tax=uncultured Oscillibacter sp. TaxID=876091 RepID=UPI0025DA079D|nr:DUF6291 domain-containing protein [uncultured Oscillibacter sp.]
MEKKIYTGFLFLPSMKMAMDELPDEKAKDLAVAIVEYGTSGIFTTDDFVIKAVMQGIKPTIDSSIRKYADHCEDGNHGGAKPKYDRDKIISLYLAGMTQEKIAAQIGCHKNTVGDAVRDYKRELSEKSTTQDHNNQYNNNTTAQQEYNNNQDKDKANDIKIKDEDKDSKMPIEKESDTLVSLLSDLCDFGNIKKINSIISKKVTKTITADLLRACLKANYDEIYDIIEGKKADGEFKYDSDPISYAIGILVKKIENGWKPKEPDYVDEFKSWIKLHYNVVDKSDPLWKWLNSVDREVKASSWLKWVNGDIDKTLMKGASALSDLQTIYDYHMFGKKPVSDDSRKKEDPIYGYDPIQDCSSVCENNFDCDDSESESELPF